MALLQHFNLTKDEFRKKFFDISPKGDETIASYSQRLSVCFDKWVNLTNIEKDYNSVRDLILSHRIFESCNPKLISFLVERYCYTVKELEENSKRFFQAHASECLGKGTNFPFSSNYAGQAYTRSRSVFRYQGHYRDRSWNSRPRYNSFKRNDENIQSFKSHFKGMMTVLILRIRQN